MSRGTFQCRIWLDAEDGDLPVIETWSFELDPMRHDRRTTAEWAKSYLEEVDINELFGLDKAKRWQIIGEAEIEGSYGYDGEWDEHVEWKRYEVATVPDDWPLDRWSNEIGPNSQITSDEADAGNE